MAVQSKYNLLDRSIEAELVPCCKSYGIGVVPWNPLERGFLTGKYRRGEKIPAGLRLTDPRYDGVLSDANFDKLAKLEAFAGERGHSVGELAIAWLLSQPWVGSVIAGATNREQLSTNVSSADWRLTAEDTAQLDKVLLSFEG